MQTVVKGTTSAPFDVDVGQTVTVTPGSGGSMLVEYTTDGEVAIRNNSATWQAWTAGTVSAETSDVCMYPLYARVTAYTASGTYQVTGSGLQDTRSTDVVWKRDVGSPRNADYAAAVVGAAGLSYEKLFQLFGDDEMILGTYANRPLATTVVAGKEFMATDLGNMRWVSDGTQWILLKPCQIVGDATQQSIIDSVGQGTTESTLYTLNLPANALGEDDGLLVDIIWSCSNSAAAKRIRTRFGGSVLSNLDLTTHLVFRQQMKMRNRNSRAAQVAQGNSTTVFGPIGSVDVQTFTVDFTAAQALTITGQFPVAGTSANDLTLEEVTINAV